MLFILRAHWIFFFAALAMATTALAQSNPKNIDSARKEGEIVWYGSRCVVAAANPAKAVESGAGNSPDTLGHFRIDESHEQPLADTCTEEMSADRTTHKA